ncbi:RE1, partial [Symbiodinium sp. KB8]
MSGASLLDSKAAFKGKVLEYGLPLPVFEGIVRWGVDTLSKAAYAVGAPGVLPSEDALRGFLNPDEPATVEQGQVAIARRLVFEAQTLAVSQLRQQIEGPDEKRQDLHVFDLRGPLEWSFSCYTIVIRMLAADEISYLAPNRFTTRAHEVQQAKPPKEVIIDSSSSIKVRDSSELADTCHLPDALSLSQALQRRSLALDLCEAATFEASERWHAELLRHLQQAPPMEYKQVDIMQILRADRAAWTYVAEKANSLKKRADGSLPMDDLFDSLTGATEVMMFLMPLPGGGHHKRPTPPEHTATTAADPATPAKKSRTKARRDRQKQRLQEALALAGASAPQAQPTASTFPPKPPAPSAPAALPPALPAPNHKGKGKGLLPVEADKVFSFNQLYALSSVIFLRATQALLQAGAQPPPQSLPGLLVLKYHVNRHALFALQNCPTLRGESRGFWPNPSRNLLKLGGLEFSPAQDWGHQTNSSTPWHCILYQCVLDAEIPGCRVVGLCCSKNFAVGLGSYTGGELFVEAPGGSVPFHDNATGEWLWGEKHALNLEPCDLSSEHEPLLLSCGFPLPWCQPNSLTAHRPETKIRMTVGVPWEPRDFAREAARRGHPRHLFDAVPPVLKAAIDAILVMSETALSQHRTEVLRRWMLRAQELESKEAQLHANMPKHLARVLEGKRLLVFGEMLADSGYGDTSIASEIGKGFDLTGPIPSSGGLFKPIVEPATMTREYLSAAAPAVRAGILQATAKACMSELAQELGDTCSLSRRFGVVQSSAGKRKVRPIDNLSESFINSTVSSVESIQPHGLDVVCAGIAYRLRVRERVGKQSVPKLKVIDLLKAYKQLGLSVDALQDSFLCVPNPATGKPCVHMCHVLPFGAAASVAAFCRTTMSLWYLGCATLLVHWTVFYDDFIVVNEAASTKHCELVLRNLWSLLGWSVAQDKETEFDYFARALGIKICFHSERLFVAENTPERKAELEETISSLLALDWVDQHALASLRGRLQFVEGQIHGWRSHKHMQVLSRRAEFIGGSAMDDDLRNALGENAWFLFTDAAYESSEESPCGIGAVLVASDGKPVRSFGLSFCEDLLDVIRFWENSSPIYFLEGLAVVAALHRWNSLIGGSEIVCFVDNEAAKSAFIATKSPSDQFGLLLDWLASWEERHSTFPWFERVSSAANIADGPSRGDFSILREVQRDDLDLPQLLRHQSLQLQGDSRQTLVHERTRLINQFLWHQRFSWDQVTFDVASKPGDEFSFLKRQHVIMEDMIVIRVGIALYISCDRPDIGYTIRCLASSMASPTVQAMSGLRKLTQYLLNTAGYAIAIKANPPGTTKLSGFPEPGAEFILEAYSDADWSGSKEDRRSYGGASYCLNGTYIHYICRAQKSVSLSSMEAEYYAAVGTASQGLFVRAVVEFMAETKGEQAAKHIEGRLLWLQNVVQQQRLSLKFVPTHKNWGDLRTKPLAPARLLALLYLHDMVDGCDRPVMGQTEFENVQAARAVKLQVKRACGCYRGAFSDALCKRLALLSMMLSMPEGAEACQGH